MRYPKAMVTAAMKSTNDNIDIFVRNLRTGDETSAKAAAEIAIPALGFSGSMEDLHNDLRALWADREGFLVAVDGASGQQITNQ